MRPDEAAKGAVGKGSVAWVEFDRARIVTLVAEGRTVLVDVTADWCLTCQVNKRLVLERGDKPRVLEESWAQDVRDYALAGGAFPITLKGFGIVGAVATSGLSERLDHTLSAAAVASVLGIDAATLALPD